jgi:hypothetical protein
LGGSAGTTASLLGSAGTTASLLCPALICNDLNTTSSVIHPIGLPFGYTIHNNKKKKRRNKKCNKKNNMAYQMMLPIPRMLSGHQLMPMPPQPPHFANNPNRLLSDSIHWIRWKYQMNQCLNNLQKTNKSRYELSNSSRSQKDLS